MIQDAQPILERYVAALLAKNEHVNLTAAASRASAFEVLVGPSLAIARAFSGDDRPRVAVDIGSGNGFPGVAVAALWPSAQVSLVERRRKKAHAIQDCLDAAGIENAEAIACDARELKNERPALVGAADLVTLRAVTSLEEGNRLAAPLLARGGLVVHWKREAMLRKEAPDGDATGRGLGLKRVGEVPHGDDAVLVVYERVGSRG